MTACSAVPHQASYRINTEKIVKHRLALIEKHANDYEAAEEAIGCGQVEELIEQARDELDLIPVLLETKCWK